LQQAGLEFRFCRNRYFLLSFSPATFLSLGSQPLMEFVAESDYGTTRPFTDSPHGQSERSLPALDGSDTAVQLRSDLFPGLQSFMSIGAGLNSGSASLRAR
jgi:hypothetical protein